MFNPLPELPETDDMDVEGAGEEEKQDNYHQGILAVGIFLLLVGGAVYAGWL